MHESRHSPTPPTVSAEKRRIEWGGRQETDAPRGWFCRSCGQESAPSRVVPPGWYSIGRHTGVAKRPIIRLGVYCSVACIARQLPRLEGIAEQQALADLTASPFVHERDAR